MKPGLLISLLFSVLLTACASAPGTEEVLRDDNIDFSQYKDFTIQPITVKGSSVKGDGMIETAIIADLEQKGLSQKPDAALRIRYAFGVKTIRDMDAHAIPVGQVTYMRYEPDERTTATLLINIEDRASNQSIWRYTGSRQVEIKGATQEKVNAALVEILEDLQFTAP